MVDPRVFPIEGIYVLVVELGVLGEHLIVVDPVLMILVEKLKEEEDWSSD